MPKNKKTNRYTPGETRSILAAAKRNKWQGLQPLSRELHKRFPSHTAASIEIKMHGMKRKWEAEQNGNKTNAVAPPPPPVKSPRKPQVERLVATKKRYVLPIKEVKIIQDGSGKLSLEFSV